MRTVATIYKNDSTQDICSADPNSQVEVTLAKCYNSTWIYYSFDLCDAPGSSSDAATSHHGGSNHAGAIAGGAVGGLLALAVLGAGIFWYMRHKKIVSRDPADIHIADSNIRHELPAEERMELSAHPHLEKICELGESSPSSLKIAPIELPTEYHADLPLYGDEKHFFELEMHTP
jgi:hypothetical protein